MKKLLVVALTLAGFSAFGLTKLPDGIWTGSGVHTEEGGKITKFTEKVTIKDNVMVGDITIDKNTFTYETTLKFGKGGHLTVETIDKTKKATLKGTGYCGSIWCHIELGEKDKFEMTFVFAGNKLYELASEIENGKKSWMESSLRKEIVKKIRPR